MWVVVIWRQNLSFFFYLVLSLLGSQSYLGCSYLKAEPFLVFHLVLSPLGSQSYLGCCYLKAKPFLFPPGSVSLGWSVLFGLLLSEGRTFPFFFLFGSVSLWELLHFRLCVFILWQTNFRSVNCDIINFTCHDFFSFADLIERYPWIIVMKKQCLF